MGAEKKNEFNFMADLFDRITFDATVQANAYVNDRGGAQSLASRIYRPPGVTAATIDLIIGQINARRRTDADRLVCPDSSDFTPRRLVFYSSQGGSVSVPMGIREDMIAAATAIRGALIADQFNVICVKLIGETFKNIIDEFRPANFTGVVPTANSSRPAAGGRQPNFFGRAAYASDAIYGTDYVLPYKIQSQASQVFPVIYGAGVLAAAGIVPITGIQGCPGSDPRKTRRYVVQSLVTDGGVVRSQQAEIPSYLHLPTEIEALGDALGVLTHVQCLGYKGESNDRFHRLLP